MANLSRRDKDLISESQALCDQGNSLIKSYSISSKKTKPVVVAWGLMNAGKSYLLNMLTQHIESEFFKTNDFRETAQIKTFESTDFIYIDTPGLDASTSDDSVALVGVEKADIVLFVHQIQGELEAIEINFLEGVVKSFGQYANDNIIIVLSKIDKESKEKVEAIRAKVLEQCQEYLGFRPKCITVSNTRYKQGSTKQQKKLMEHSNVENLYAELQTKVESISKVRQERQVQEKQQLIEKLMKQKKCIESSLMQHEKIINKLNKDAKSFNSDMESLIGFIKETSEEYYNLES